jgi:O2-independent ubiquinone biosynthesis protein UbiV
MKGSTMPSLATLPTLPSAAQRRFGLTVGPLQYWWSREATWAFYADVADSAADTVVLGEVVCSRRTEIKADDWLDLAADLAAQGKTVVLATQSLVAGEAELRTLRRLCEQDRFAVEAGDASALAVLAPLQAANGARLPFVIGPHVNVYNRAALEELAPLGALRWVPPLELALDAVACVNPQQDPVRGPAGAVVTELFAFGRMPLAFSARCFTARHYRLKKDACEFRCRDDADGLLLSADDGQPFLALNGIQTQSAALHCLIGEGQAMQGAGVSRIRLSPCSTGFMRALDLFDGVLNAGASACEARAELERLGLPGALVNGYAHRKPGLQAVVV